MIYRNGYEVIKLHQLQAAQKTALAFVVKMDEPFECVTMEGVVQGKAGDYLAVGVKNEVYPINQEVFESSYAIVDNPKEVAKKLETILMETNA
jgi:hypothetical protein